MSITVKLVNGTQKSVDVPRLDINVTELKGILAAAVDIPADEQRIVLRGKILKDDDILSDAGLEHGNAIHVVRKKKPQTEAAASPAASSQAPPAIIPAVPAAAPSTPTPAAAANPYAALTLGRFGSTDAGSGGGGMGFPGMPDLGQAFNMASAMQGGGAGGANPNTAGHDDLSAGIRSQMMQNPAMIEMAAQLMRNPQFMQQVMQENQMMANMTPEMQQSMLTLMGNPDFMRLAIGLSSSMGGGAMPPAAGGVSQAPAYSPAMPNNVNAAAAGGGLNSLASMNSLLSVPHGNPRDLYREQLRQLREMGFPNEEANLAALQQSHGNMDFAIERLFNPWNNSRLSELSYFATVRRSITFFWFHV